MGTARSPVGVSGFSSSSQPPRIRSKGASGAAESISRGGAPAGTSARRLLDRCCSSRDACRTALMVSMVPQLKTLTQWLIVSPKSLVREKPVMESGAAAA